MIEQGVNKFPARGFGTACDFFYERIEQFTIGGKKNNWVGNIWVIQYLFTWQSAYPFSNDETVTNRCALSSLRHSKTTVQRRLIIIIWLQISKICDQNCWMGVEYFLFIFLFYFFPQKVQPVYISTLMSVHLDTLFLPIGIIRLSHTPENICDRGPVHPPG